MEKKDRQSGYAILASQLYEVEWQQRYAILQKNIDQLITDIGKPKIKANDTKVIARLIRFGASILSIGFIGLNPIGALLVHSSPYEKIIDNMSFSDLMAIFTLKVFWYNRVPFSYYKKTLKSFLKCKAKGEYIIKYPYESILAPTNGLILYREQAAELISNITDISHEEALLLYNNLRKGRIEAKNFDKDFILAGQKKGISNQTLKDLWFKLEGPARQLLAPKSYVMVSCWLAYQIEYLGYYYANELEEIFKELEQFNLDGYIKEITDINNLPSSYVQ